MSEQYWKEKCATLSRLLDEAEAKVKEQGDRREQALKVAIRDLTQTNKSIEGQLEECEKEREGYRLQVVARRTEIAGLRSRLDSVRELLELDIDDDRRWDEMAKLFPGVKVKASAVERRCSFSDVVVTGNPPLRCDLPDGHEGIHNLRSE